MTGSTPTRMVHFFATLSLLLPSMFASAAPAFQNNDESENIKSIEAAADPSIAPFRWQEASMDFQTLADETIQIVEENFYSPTKFTQPYQLAKHQLLIESETCKDRKQFAESVNRWLATLHASHTYYMTPDDVEFYHIAAIFEKIPKVASMFKDQPIVYPSIGVITQWVDQKWLVASILPGGPSDGLLQIGDHLQTTNHKPFTPVRSLIEHINQATEFGILRDGQASFVKIVPLKVHPKKELLDALNSSIKISEIDGRKIGYVHIYSYAGIEYQNALEESIAWGDLKNAEAMVIDLRFGLGGANAKYLNIFHRNIPTSTMIDRNGNSTIFDSQWRKPAVILVDQTSRSGKEVFAYGAQKHKYAKIVGTPTAGAVLAGSPFPISNGDLLYLAVRDVMVDGLKLEGVGVQPDILVPLDLKTGNGRDTQVEASLKEAAKMLAPRPVDLND